MLREGAFILILAKVDILHVNSFQLVLKTYIGDCFFVPSFIAFAEDWLTLVNRCLTMLDLRGNICPLISTYICMSVGSYMERQYKTHETLYSPRYHSLIIEGLPRIKDNILIISETIFLENYISYQTIMFSFVTIIVFTQPKLQLN